VMKALLNRFLIILIPFMLVLMAGASNGLTDAIKDKYSSTILYQNDNFPASFWNPRESWKNKWKIQGDIITGYERFWGSSTIFVFLTDAWHLFKSLMLWLFTIAIVTYKFTRKWYLWISDIILLKIAFSSGFHLMQWILL
jgi:hypothetical protein